MSTAEWVTVALSLVALGVSIASYCHASSIKRLDLRIEARKARTSLARQVKDIRGLMHTARESRLQVFAAASRLQSGILAEWERELAQKAEELEKLAAEFRADEGDYQTMSDGDLEAEIVHLHRISTEVSAIEGVYRGSLAEDARAGERVRMGVESGIQSR